MKKLILTCTLALGIFANAQFSQNFDAGTTAPAGWSVINDGGNGFIFGVPPAVSAGVPGAHSGANVASIKFDTAAHNDFLVTPAITVTAGVNDRLSFWVASYSASFLENYNVMLSTGPVAPTVPADFTVTLKGTTKAPNTWKKEVIDLTPYIGTTVYVGLHAVDTDQFYLYFDDVVNDSAPTTVPSCTVLSAPADAATGITVRPGFAWNAATGAELGYKLSVGTTSGGTDVLNAVPVNALKYDLPLSSAVLAANTKYYAKVVAYNAVGDATGCTETTFTTGANAYAPYCGPHISSTPTQLAPITSFTLNTITNDTDAAATSVGAFAVNETFLSSNITVLSDLTTIPFSLTGIGITGNGWATSIFVDWNNDGDFLDAGESYFNTTASIKRSTTVSAANKVTLTGTLSIPAGTAFGVKRVRVKYNFSGTTINGTLTTACTDMTNGQVEDYAIDYKEKVLAVSNGTKEGLSIYPNPFQNVLKISDVKGVKSVVVSDVSGRQVKSMAPSTELDLSALKTGLYIVTLQMEDGTVKSFKAVKN